MRNYYACFEHNSTSWWTSLKMNFIEFEKRAAWERCALKLSRWLYEFCCCGWLPGRCEELALIPTLGEHFFFCLPFIHYFLFIALFIAFQNKDVWIMKWIRVHIDERFQTKRNVSCSGLALSQHKSVTHGRVSTFSPLLPKTDMHWLT